MLLKTVDLDSNRYALAEGTTIRRRSISAFAQVQRDNAQVQLKDFGLFQQISLKGPLSVGQREGNDVTKCWDQYNVMTRWPNLLLRGPRLQTPTQTAIPSGFVVQRGAGFFEGNGQLIVHGDASGAVNGEPLHYFVGSTATWTNGTLNADLTADVENIVGVTFGEGRWWAVADQLQSDGANTRITYKSDGVAATPTVWQRANTNAANESLGTTPFTSDRIRFLEYAASTRASQGAARLYAVSYENSTGRSMITMRATTAGVSWDDGANQEIPADSSGPRGLALFPGEDNLIDVIAATAVGLYRFNISGGAQFAEELYLFREQSGDYTGAMVAGPDGSLWFLDGPTLGQFFWLDGNGKRQIRYHELNTPLEAFGDFTAIAASKERPWIYLAKGGLAASRNARIYIFDYELGRWFCIYRHATAQRAITALAESREDDGVPRLHFMVESAAGGDQDAQYFLRVVNNPLDDTAFEYAASGTIVDSERKPLGGLYQVGWRAVQVDADSLSANEYVTVRDGQNGATPGGAQNITSTTSPAQVWPDKTDATAGVGVAGRRQQIEVDLVGTAGTTVGPTVKDINITFRTKGLKPDGTTPEEFEFVVDLDASKGFGTRRGNPKGALTDLQTSENKQTLVALGLDGGETVYVEMELRDATMDPQLQAAVQQAPAGGRVVVFCEESLR